MNTLVWGALDEKRPALGGPQPTTGQLAPGKPGRLHLPRSEKRQLTWHGAAMLAHVFELAEANANVWADMHAPWVRALVHVKSLEVLQEHRRGLPITLTVNKL